MEVLKVLQSEFSTDVWRNGEGPRDWCDAVLVPLPKQGDDDNWRGISLLDVWGRWWHVCSRNGCRSKLKCWFKKSRGCTNTIFTVRQLVEKSWEYTARHIMIQCHGRLSGLH